MTKTCEIAVYRGGCEYCEGRCCNKCRIGCFQPARFRNPFFGKEMGSEHYWWRGMYSYAEWLCAECYDDMIREGREWEDRYREHEGSDFEEDAEFSAIMKTL